MAGGLPAGTDEPCRYRHEGRNQRVTLVAKSADDPYERGANICRKTDEFAN